MSPSKESKLKKIDIVTTKKKTTKEKTSKGSEKKENKNKLASNKHSESQQPSTSGLNAPYIDYYDSKLTDDEANSTPCCVCGNASPEINLIYTLEIIQWGKCDKCSHSTYLK
ncbi:hypothetical protein DPMN_131513 [Dreissena polymorpha]|uniref:Uncharacterized protein n=1 Tax=Dreissena polymorpha TaxID=45954 RepID=A0A9D4HD39_DREPO|nr:hypothetical protein DPMN_131513 [Dreissena polymorpha]